MRPQGNLPPTTLERQRGGYAGSKLTAVETQERGLCRSQCGGGRIREVMGESLETMWTGMGVQNSRGPSLRRNLRLL